jgi:hypothetical protein
VRCLVQASPKQAYRTEALVLEPTFSIIPCWNSTNNSAYYKRPPVWPWVSSIQFICFRMYGKIYLMRQNMSQTTPTTAKHRHKTNHRAGGLPLVGCLRHFIDYINSCHHLSVSSPSYWVTKLPDLYGKRNFITVSPSAHFWTTLIQLSPILILKFYFYKIRLNIILRSTPRSPKWPLSFIFSGRTSVCIYHPLLRATYAMHLTLSVLLP